MSGQYSLNGNLLEIRAEHEFYWYRGDILSIEIRSSDFDSQFMLRSPSAVIIRGTDDCGGTKTACLNRQLLTETGTYTLIVQSFDRGGTGSYRLNLEYIIACSHTAPIAIVTMADSNLRTSAGQAYPLAGRVQAGDCLEILGVNERETWLYVQSDALQEGWINASLVQIFDELFAIPTALP